jgi:hypothetical protein
MPSSRLDLKELLSRFAATISDGSLGLVEHVPDPAAQAMHHIQNVLLKVNREGGSAIYGWVFLSRESAHGQYLIALHHSIWSPVGGAAAIDITPFHPDPKYQPYCPAAGRVLFLIDEAARPKTIGSALAPLPSRFFPVTEEPNLVAYVEALNAEEQTHFQTMSASSTGAAGSQRTH